MRFRPDPKDARRLGLAACALAVAGALALAVECGSSSSPTSSFVPPTTSPPTTPSPPSEPAPPASNVRGRARIVNGILVADNGAPLRGAHGSPPYAPTKDLSWWLNLRDNYNLNTVRIMHSITRTSGSTDIADALPREPFFREIDALVDNAEKAGMYVILDNHTSCCGKYDLALMRYFWEYAAPRYKDRPHVIYELQNEPGPSNAKYSDQLIADEVEIYHMVRQLAPNTHIIMWSFAKTFGDMLATVEKAPSVSYANASVGVHPYTAAFGQIDRLRNAGYPVVITEFGDCCGLEGRTGEVFDWAEANGVSWIFLDLNPKIIHGGVSHPDLWPLTWPPDPHYH